MKKTFRLMAMALMGATMLGFAACGDDDDDKNTDTPYYSIKFGDRTYTDGDTITFDATGIAPTTEINLYAINLTQGDLSTTQLTQQLEGDYDFLLCYGGQCSKAQDIEFSLPATFSEDMNLISIHVTTPEDVYGPALFKLTVGQGAAKAHAVSAYIKMTRNDPFAESEE